MLRSYEEAGRQKPSITNPKIAHSTQFAHISQLSEFAPRDLGLLGLSSDTPDQSGPRSIHPILRPRLIILSTGPSQESVDSYPPRRNGLVRLPGQFGNEVVEVGEAGVVGVPAEIASIDLLDDHGDLEKAEGVKVE